MLQTSDRNTTIIRLRTEEEVAAKRARRKKRDKEKGKKKGEAEGEVAEEEDSAIKYEERVVEWCTIRLLGRNQRRLSSRLNFTLSICQVIDKIFDPYVFLPTIRSFAVLRMEVSRSGI
jgi:hypothetical protein